MPPPASRPSTTSAARAAELPGSVASTTAPVDVAVVVVSWNTRDFLESCLRSVFEQTRVSFQVVVVDNASADGSAEMIRSRFPQVELIANADNVGFAAANNQAFQRARARYVLLLNPDTVVLDGAIDRAVRFADADPSIGVLGCQVLEGDGTIQHTCFRFPSPLNLFLLCAGLPQAFPRSRWLGRATMESWDRRSQRDVDVVSGMFMLVRAEALAAVGVMDPAYFVYAEEADWCFRFRRAGWRCVFAPIGQIRHEGGGGKSTSQVRVKMYVQLQKSLLIFHRKNLGWTAWLMAKLIYIAAMLVRAGFWWPRALLGGGPGAAQKARCASAALWFQLTGIEPRA